MPSGSSAARGPRRRSAFDFCKKWLSFGAGPRASLGLIMAAKAHALIQGQTYVGCENVAAIALAVMRHRIAINFTAQSEGDHRRTTSCAKFWRKSRRPSRWPRRTRPW